MSGGLDEAAFVAALDRVSAARPDLDPLAAGLLAALDLGLPGDSRTFARTFGVEHALVLRALSGLEERPIRWICEDARRYVQREVRRGSRYEGIILDPPKYGRGPDGEVWRLFEDLPELAALCAELLSEQASFLILNAYAARISGAALASLLADRLVGRGGRVEWGELALVEASGERAVGLSF